MGKTHYFTWSHDTARKHPHNVGKTFSLSSLMNIVSETSPQRGEDHDKKLKLTSAKETSPQRGEDTLETFHFEISPETSPQRGEDSFSL